MGLFDWAKGQFIDVIDWTDDSSDTMVYRFERHNNEIKYGAKLTVRESQIAVFVNEGVIADILEPGIYELETQNMPIMTSLNHWDHGFNSPFKAEVYFVNTKRFTNLRWGTKNPIMVRDPEFAMVRLRAFGTYEIRISDVKIFLNDIVGTDGHFTTDEITSQLTNLIVSKFANIVGKDSTPALDLAGNYDLFGEYLTEHIGPAFKEYGLELTRMLIENISLPEAVEKAIDARSSRAVTGNLDDHLKYQAGLALGDSGSGMSEMASMGAGLAMGQQMAGMMGAMQNNQQATSSPSNAAPSMPPPLPTATEYFVAINGKSEGPYLESAIKEFIKSKKISRSTKMWKEGMSDWEEAKEVVSTLFSSMPPPLG